MNASLMAAATISPGCGWYTLHVLDNGRGLDVRVLGRDCPESKHNAECREEGAAACDAEIPRAKVAMKRARELSWGPTEDGGAQGRSGC